MKRPVDLIRWFLPGLGVKRWLIVAAVGAVIFVNGVSRWLTDEGTHFPINEFVDNALDDFIRPEYLSYLFTTVGVILIALGIWRWLKSIVSAVVPNGNESMIDAILDSRLKRGYKIVAIGGGTGLSTMLRGLKRYTANLTAIVTVTDDGGSSGRLQKELGILPPGDIRNCLVALANDEAMVTDLFRYRFSEGEGLSGHAFGNLFLAAMTGVTGNFDLAVKESSRSSTSKAACCPRRCPWRNSARRSLTAPSSRANRRSARRHSRLRRCISIPPGPSPSTKSSRRSVKPMRSCSVPVPCIPRSCRICWSTASRARSPARTPSRSTSAT